MRPGIGYWVKVFNDQCQITFQSNEKVYRMDIPELKRGLNLIGINTDGLNISRESGECQITKIFSYVDGDYQLQDSTRKLESGKGYWVVSDNDCKFIRQYGTILLSKNTISVKTTESEVSDSFTITASNGTLEELKIEVEGNISQHLEFSLNELDFMIPEESRDVTITVTLPSKEATYEGEILVSAHNVDEAEISVAVTKESGIKGYLYCNVGNPNSGYCQGAVQKAFDCVSSYGNKVRKEKSEVISYQQANCPTILEFFTSRGVPETTESERTYTVTSTLKDDFQTCNQDTYQYTGAYCCTCNGDKGKCMCYGYQPINGADVCTKIVGVIES